jgi:hypothetical protein
MAAVLCADMSDSILAVPKIEHLALHGMAFVPITETLSEALLLSSESPSYTRRSRITNRYAYNYRYGALLSLQF